MKHKPMEEKVSQEWGLITYDKDFNKILRITDKIAEKIYEGYSDSDTLKDILDAKKLVVCSYALGKILASRVIGLKSAQLRRFYESLLNVRAIVTAIRTKPNASELFDTKVMPEILMLKPQLANAKARQKREVTPFFNVINPLIDLVKSIEDYDRLCKFVESIVAYHKYCGGRDN